MMIKRHYFGSYKKYHDDGKASFSWRHVTFTRTSLLPNPHEAFAAAIKRAKDDMAEKPGGYDNVQCIAFNRI